MLLLLFFCLSFHLFVELWLSKKRGTINSGGEIYFNEQGSTSELDQKTNTKTKAKPNEMNPPQSSNNKNTILPASQINRPTERKFAPAPANYVAGLGRGATGFTTRSDIGPARVAAAAATALTYTGPGQFIPGTSTAPPTVSFGAVPANYVAGRGRGAFGFGAPPPTATPMTGVAMPGTMPLLLQQQQQQHRGRGGDDDESSGGGGGAAFADSNFDNWSGFNDRGLFSTMSYEADDREADEQWEMVDKRMEQRKKKKLLSASDVMMNKSESSNSNTTATVVGGEENNQQKIAQQFVDLKRKLADVSVDEWSKIPEVADRSIKKRKFVRYSAVPDTLLERAQKESILSASSSASSSSSSSIVGGAQTDLRALGEARESIMRNQLKIAEDSVSGQTNIDPRGYLTGLDSLSIIDSAELGDLKRARELLRSVTTTNPTHAPAWIARARIEEIGARNDMARKYIMEGCERCGKHSEDIWLEAARLHPPKVAKSILARAVNTLTTDSIQIWLRAASLETSVKAKKNIIHKALEVMPNSVQLWKEAIELEEDENDARVLLSRAVEAIPQNVDLWLALARLETYKNAKIVLNKARKQLPSEPVIWIAAAELEEANLVQSGTVADTCVKHVQAIINKGLEQLAKYESVLNRENWIKYAKKAEEAKHIHTLNAIINSVIGWNLEESNKKHTWIKDAEEATREGFLSVARAIYSKAVSEFPNKAGLWRRFAMFEKKYGSSDAFIEVLKKAVVHRSEVEEFWLMCAKEIWVTKNDVDGARSILLEAASANPDSDNIWLAAVKLEFESGEYDKARELLEKARVNANAARVWMKSAVFERNAGHDQQEWNILKQAITEFPTCDKLWIMAGQWHERKSDIPSAREYYLRGLQNNPKSIALWLCLAKMEFNTGGATKARPVLDKARLRNPASPELWLASVRIEKKDIDVAKSVLAKALQECPKSGLLWAKSIDLEIRAKQKAQGALALRNCEDPLVFISIARILWRERKLDKAKEWLTRAITANKDLGDAWINLYAFELEHGTQESQEEVLKNCVLSDPHHGELWTKTSKDVKNHMMSTKDILITAALNLGVELEKDTFSTYVAPSEATE